MDLYERLAPYIQDYIYRSGWTQFREIQVAACELIFGTDAHIVLSSGTASGKTEAAFLPALTLLDENPSSSVGILYISPLKALINDQFVRIGRLLEESDIPVCRWHGDAPDGAKRRMLRNPRGVLQITPESLESLLINRRESCIRLFSDLRFIIVDEMHYFMESPRGVQLLSLLERMERLAGCRPRRIGLSATLSDPDGAAEWLSCGTKRKCLVPEANSGRRRARVSMRGFLTEEKNGQEKEKPGRGGACAEEGAEAEESCAGQGGFCREHLEYLYQVTRDKKALIFTASRAEAELMTAGLRSLAAEYGTPDCYQVHHGSISAILREETEQKMRESETPVVTAATVTLELGIDIGSLDCVVQAGPPLTVSGLVQRIGRCGRRGQTAELFFTFEESKESRNTAELRKLNWGFLKTLAMIRLLAAHFTEPVPPFGHPYAVLYHQTLSVLLAKGELSPARLAQTLLTLGVFRNITQEDYRTLLRHMLAIGHLQRTERGGLIIGQKAERIVSGYRFYSVFEAQEEYLVREENRLIGSVTEPYPEGERFTLAGRAWETTGIDAKGRILYVRAVPGIPKVHWNSPMRHTIHAAVLRKMREILTEDEEYAFLSGECKEELARFRTLAAALGFARNPVLELSEGGYAVFPWAGTGRLAALFHVLEQEGIMCRICPGESMPIYLEVTYPGSAEALEELVRGFLKNGADKESLKLPDTVEIPCKYNGYIPKELLVKQYREDYLESGPEL